VDLFDRLEAARERWNVLDHPFYRRWSAGELTRAELAAYAGEYRHAVVALAEAVEGAAAEADPAAAGELSEHAAEEAAHVDLWDDFAQAVGADLHRDPRAETSECVAAWTGGRDTLERLVASFVVEAAQPAISQTKLEGLVRHYGLDEGPATEYFALHAERDHEHAAHTRRLIEERLDGTDEDRLVKVGEDALRGNWRLLDGMEQPAAAT
jgi:pyrroloquinoline-quinone synthase